MVRDGNWGVIPSHPITGPHRNTIILILEKNKECQTVLHWESANLCSWRLPVSGWWLTALSRNSLSRGAGQRRLWITYFHKALNCLHRSREGITRQASREGGWTARMIPYCRSKKGGPDNGLASSGLSEATTRERWQIRDDGPGFQMQWDRSRPTVSHFSRVLVFFYWELRFKEQSDSYRYSLSLGWWLFSLLCVEKMVEFLEHVEIK